ncbi:glycosyltransferase [Halioglobus maricola]|uniref:Glycosyltransferase n=1 Tax=Halioglobus maricola TaxID=2601894 RepID=A0A5P9NFQ4_9GAMM|nr:WecB/TagA/CpsF family glycosyltransferase [Halioglobus maricola]QFU74620.1 glycosyltransferase [Halioglobus maricola]
MNRKKINGVEIYAPHSREELIDFAFENKSLLVAVNAEKILHATENSRDIINRNVGYPDGLGAVMGLKQQGERAIKIPGCELWLDIIKYRYQDSSYYLVGSKQPVIEKAVDKLQQEYPGISILNYRNGYIGTEEEKQSLMDDITRKKPDVVFVAMGSPKQELLMEEMSRHHPAVYQGLGGSFDVYTNSVQRAPAWWVEHHLEWFYRLLKEPSRLRRQIHLLRFLLLLKLNKFSQ